MNTNTLEMNSKNSNKLNFEIEGISPKREYKYDNLRFVLIILVVWGHCLESFNTGVVLNIYRIIYSFHMPAFIFLSGYFARFNPGKIIKRFLIPYFLFQTLFLMYDSFLLGNNDFVLQFTTPYWILWYLVAVGVYNILLPFLPQSENDYKKAKLTIMVTLALALNIGFDETAGYYMSLSRVVVFFPFFVWGYCHEALEAKFKKIITAKSNYLITVVVLFCVVLFGECYYIVKDTPVLLMYSSSSYQGCGCTVLDRLIFMVTATGGIIFARLISPNIKIRFLSVLGQNTMPIFLLHPFVIKLLRKFDLFRFSMAGNIIFACIVTFLIVLILGNSFCGRLFKKFMG